VSGLSATLLVLSSAVLHAAWNAVLRKQREPRVAGVLILGVAALCAGVAAALVSRTAFPSREALGWTLASGLGEAAYFATLARALQEAPLGIAYTVSRGGAILVVWPASVAWLGERFHPLTAVGAGLVLVGLVLTGSVKGLRTAGHLRGVGWSVSCAVFIALVYLAYKRALAAQTEPTALFATSLGVAVPLNVVALRARAPARLVEELRIRPWSIVLAGVVCTASFLLFLGALQESGAGRVLTLRNTSVVFAFAFGWLFGERPTRLQVVGGTLVAAGATLLGAS
jgi:drug/metabolite transporter (DMT)-like permease